MMRTKGKKWEAEALIAEIRKARRKKMELTELASSLGVKVDRLYYLIDRYPTRFRYIRRKGNTKLPAEVKKVQALCPTHTRNQIAHKLGISYFRVCRICLRYRFTPIKETRDSREAAMQAHFLKIQKRWTLEEIGNELGYSKQYIHQLLTKHAKRQSEKRKQLQQERRADA